ncbi:FGGY family carbohydrate kinase [Georgenia alba]|uniref:FGGY family carbohydrate kinase n=1 Tax=Georgenia alba TaxID=2233858 RepID=A0ABW2Q9P0_9MICO
MTLALGIDVGTTNTKAALVAVDGAGVEELAVTARPTPDDAPGLLATVDSVAGEVLRATDDPPQVVGVASMAETGVALDAADRPVTELLRWDAHRATEQARRLADRVGADRLFAGTGVRPSGKAPLATWAWLRDRDVAFRRWAGAADLVVLALTGRLVTDHTLAGRTMAYRTDGPPSASFDGALLDIVGLRPAQLPAVAPPEGVAGHASTHAARRSGLDGLAARLPDGTPVVVAGHDHSVGSWAAGARGTGARACSVGTAEAAFTILSAAPDTGPVAAAGMSRVRTADGRHHALLAGSPSAGSMLGWLEEHIDGPVEDALAAAAQELRAHPGPPAAVVLPYRAGRQAPRPDPAATVRVLRHGAAAAEARDLDAAALARAVLDGLALQARWMLTEQARLGDTEPGALTLLGSVLDLPGVIESRRLALTGPLRHITAREPVATGAGLLAAARAGLLGPPQDALRDAPRLPATDLPARPDRYGDALEAFVRAATEGAR